QVPLRPMTYK
nr:Chain C, Negative factor [Human immunodeficiency virus 1]1QVO_F Chain F, Negative factor [Human immunodeficiency virus 1]3RL2_C Chain C, Nef73 peptide from Protein Nef [Human immunodeficiency virus 1]